MTSSIETPTASDPVEPPRKGRIKTFDPTPIIPWVPIGQVYVAGRTTYNKVATPPAVRQATVAGQGEMLPLIYGTDQIGAKVTEAVSLGTDGYLRLEWCEGVVDAISSVLVDGEAPAAGVTFTHYDGSQVTPDASLVAAFAAQGITYTDTLTGIAYSVGKFPAGSTRGFPRCIAQVRGVKVKTSAAGAPAYNDNPVWLIAYLLTEKLGASIDWTSFATAAADACDVMVGSPAEKKRVIGATLDTEQSVNQWLSVALGYAGCFLWYDNGVYGLTADVATTPTAMSVTEALMKGGELQLQSRNTRKSPNVVRVYYTNTTVSPWVEEYAEAELPGLGPSDPRRVSEIRMPWINRHSHANREAIEALNGFTLNNLSGTFTTRDEGLILLPGDIITLTHSLGLTAKKMRVLAATPVDAGRYRVEVQEFDPAKYSSVVVTGPTYVDTTLPSAGSPPTVGALTLTEEIVTTASGSLPTSRIRATWPIPVYPLLVGYQVVVTDPLGVVLDDAPVTSNEYVSPPLVAFSTYVVNVYARSSLARSATPSIGRISLVSAGVNSMAEILGVMIPQAGWTFYSQDGFPAPTLFKLWDGDPYARVRFDMSPVETTVYPGSNQLTPGMSTQLRDGEDLTLYPSFGFAHAALNYVLSFPVPRSVLVAVLNIGTWLELYDASMVVRVRLYDASLIEVQLGDHGTVVGTGKYVSLYVQCKDLVFFGANASQALRPNWQIEFDAARIAAFMPTVTDEITANSSAAGPLTITLPRKYIVANMPFVQPIGSTFLTGSPSNLVLSETLDNTVDINVFDGTGARVAAPVVIKITGVPAP